MSDSVRAKAEEIADALEIGDADERDVVVAYLTQALIQHAAERTAGLRSALEDLAKGTVKLVDEIRIHIPEGQITKRWVEDLRTQADALLAEPEVKP